MNEYDDLVKQKFPTPDEYGSRIDSERDIQKSALKQSMFAASQTTPDAEAEAIHLSDQIKAPVGVVRKNMETFSKKRDLLGTDYDSLITKNPRLSKWMENPSNAGVTRDDIPTLRKIEDDVKDHGFWHDVGLRGARALAQSGEIIANIPRAAWQLGTLPGNFMMDMQVEEPDLLKDNPVIRATKEAQQFYTDRLKDKDVQFSDVFSEAGKGNWTNAGKHLAYKIVDTAPPTALIALEYIASGGVAALGTAGGIAAGSAAGDQNGSATTPVERSVNTAVNTGAELAFEGLFGTLNIAKRTINEVKKQYGTNAATGAAKSFVKTFFKNSFEEGASESATEVVQRLSNYLTGVDPSALDNLGSDVIGAGIVGGVMGAGFVTPVATMEGINQARLIREANKAREIYNTTGANIESSKLKERNLPQVLENYMEAVTNGTPVENVYINANAFNSYFQSKDTDPDQAAEALGITKEYGDARETGSEDIKVPFSKWTSRVVGTEAYSALQNDVKFNPEGKSVNGLKEEADQSITAQEISEPQDLDPNTQVYNAAKEQLTSIGMPETEAEINARVLAERNKVRAKDRGVDPLVQWKEEGLQVIRGEQAIEGALNQSAPGMYSKLQSDIEQKLGNTATREQVEAVLRDVKAEEREWSGIDSFLEGKEKVSKSELLDYLRANEIRINQVTNRGDNPENYSVRTYGEDGEFYSLVQDESEETLHNSGPFKTEAEAQNDAEEFIDRISNSSVSTKFSKYTLPGGENYREILFTLPYQNQISSAAADEIQQLEKIKASFQEEGNTERVLELQSEIQELKSDAGDQNNYRSSHFDEPNILAHARVNDRVDADGKRILFIEEIQSDWHQEGRKKGYNNPEQAKEIANLHIKQNQILDQMNALERDGKQGSPEYLDLEKQAIQIEETFLQSRRNPKGVPNAPFKKSWHEFVLKRLIRQAAEQGYDKIAWTTGEQQAERYDLSKQIDRVELVQSGNTDVLRAYGKSGEEVLAKSVESGADLSDYIGKEAAQKLVEMKWGRKDKKGLRKKVLNNADLKVGGEGMKGFYDKILVDAANKIAKKFGGRVEESSFDVGDANETGIANVHSLELTPALKATAIEQGFPLFQGGPEAPRGQALINDTQRIIALLKSADKSTFMHESAHVWLDQISRDFKESTISEDYKKTAQAILDYLGVDSFDKIETKHHEKFADSFEAYLQEGKAPSSRLKRAFNSFKRWLLQIYKGVPKVGINDDIRKVFDRLLAVEEGVEAEAPDVNQNVLSRMDPKLAERYQNDVAKYKEALKEKIYKEVQIREDAQYKEERKKQREIAESDINNTRVYTAMANMQKGLQANGDPLPEGVPWVKLSKKELLEHYPQEYVSNLPRGIFDEENSVPYEMAAEMFMFEDGDEFLQALANAPKKQEAIEQLTDARMEEIYPTPRINIEEELHNDERMNILHTELSALSDATIKEGIRKIARRVPTRLQVREQAQDILATQKINDIDPSEYLRTERRMAKEAGELFAKGDLGGAYEAKEKELLNAELYKAATEAQKQVKESTRFFRKILKSDEDISKSRDIDLVNAARALLANFGLGKTEKTADDYLRPVKSYDPEGYSVIKAMMGDLGLETGSYRQMPYAQFNHLDETVRGLWSLARSEKQIEIEGKKIAKDQAVNELIGNIPASSAREGYRKTASTWDGMKIALMSWGSKLRRMESWVDAMDLGKITGPYRTYLFNSIRDGTSQFRLSNTEMLKKFQAIVKPIAPTLNDGPIPSPELNFEFKNKGQLIGAILHTGNPSNFNKLIKGWNWNEEAWNAFFKRATREGIITKADMDAVQSIWDLFRELKPQAQRAHKKMFGFYFGELTEAPVQTPFGEYKGGYYPAVPDPMESRDSSIRNEQAMLERFSESFSFPAPGFTKGRVEDYAVPLQMDLGKVPAHLNKVLRFIHIKPAVKDAAKLSHDRRFTEALDQFDPTVRNEMIFPFFKRSDQQIVSEPSKGMGADKGDALARHLRKSSGMQIMVANFANTIQQFTGLSIAALKVNPKYLRNATWKYMRAPQQTSNMVNEKSDFMKTRSATQAVEINQNIQEMIANPSKYEKMLMFAEKNGYILQQITQGVVDNITWSAAYDQAVSKGFSEKDAVKSADSAVTLTQGSFNPEDISKFEAGSPFVRLFTMFYSYFNMQANLLATEFVKTTRESGLTNGAGRLFYIYTMGFMIPAVMSELINQAFSGRPFDEDDDESYLDDFMAIFFGSQWRSFMAMVPGVGQVTNTAVNYFNKKPYDDKMSVSPVIQSLESSARAPNSIYKAVFDDGPKKKAVRDTLTLLGLLTGLPLGALGRPLGYLADIQDEKVEPSGPIDFTRGILTGR